MAFLLKKDNNPFWIIVERRKMGNCTSNAALHKYSLMKMSINLWGFFVFVFNLFI